MGSLVTFWQGMNYLIVRSLIVIRSQWCFVADIADTAGRVRLLQQFRDCRQHLLAFDLGRGIPSVRSNHVPEAGRAVGHVPAGFPVCGLHSRTDPFLLLWSEDPGKIEVHANGMNDVSEFKHTDIHHTRPRLLDAMAFHR